LGKTHTTVYVDPYLLEKAKKQNVNCSKVFREALKKKMDPTIEELEEEKEELENEYEARISEINAKIKTLKKQRKEKLEKGEAPRGKVKIVGGRGKKKWVCPECGCQVPVDERKCVKTGCNYKLTDKEWEYVKENTPENATEKIQRTTY